MLSSTTYVARPHSKVRMHAIPTDAIERATGERSRSALNQKSCLFEIFVKSRTGRVKVMPAVVLIPTSGGEVYVSKEACPEYPERFGVDEYLIVRLTMLETS